MPDIASCVAHKAAEAATATNWERSFSIQTVLACEQPCAQCMVIELQSLELLVVSMPAAPRTMHHCQTFTVSAAAAAAAA